MCIITGFFILIYAGDKSCVNFTKHALVLPALVLPEPEFVEQPHLPTAREPLDLRGLTACLQAVLASTASISSLPSRQDAASAGTYMEDHVSEQPMPDLPNQPTTSQLAAERIL